MNDKPPSKEEALRQLREAIYKANHYTPEASGTARKAPSGELLGSPSRNSVRASTHPVAKATKGRAGTAGIKGPIRRSTAGTGLRVGEAIAELPATSEIMGVTAGETAPKFDRNAYQREYMRKRREKDGALKSPGRTQKPVTMPPTPWDKDKVK